jgi:hypothetical protein
VVDKQVLSGGQAGSGGQARSVVDRQVLSGGQAGSGEQAGCSLHLCQFRDNQPRSH